MPPGGPGFPGPDPTTVLLPSKVIFGKYEIGRLLGCGAFAKVYHARDLRSGQSVAIKCISKLRLSSSSSSSKANNNNNHLSTTIIREVSIMRRLHHPHIVRLIEVLASRSKIYFVIELLKGGELFARIASRGQLPEQISRKIFHQLVSAVAFCHSRGVYHRDLKPENLLLDEHGNVKVSDFGLSALSDRTTSPDGIFHTVCGTPAYVAPEVLAKKGYDGAKVDIWSCGVILFVLNAGYLPFNDTNLMQLYRKIYRGQYRIPKWTSPELKRLISRLLDTNPATRITIEGILDDPWFKKGLEEEKMRAMMSFHAEVEDRIAAKDAAGDVDRELNAFDLISLSPGFDLSGLFDGKTERSRFVSDEPAEAILDRVEEIGRREGLVVRRRKEKVGRGGVAVEGQNGNFVTWVEVYRLSSKLIMVQIEKGDSEDEGRWNSQFWRERLGPASEPSTPMGGEGGGGGGGRRNAGLAFGSVGSASEPTSPMAVGTGIL